MGLGNSERGIFLQIVDGQIARRRPAAIPGSTKERTTSTGKIVHEELYDHVSGFIIDIQIQAPKQGYETYGDTLIIKMVDGQENFILQMQKDGGYATAFFRVLPNIDFTKRTTIIPSMKMENDKKKVTIFINQQGVTGALKHYYTKDDPKGMPGLVKITVRGKDQWDNTDMMKFFVKELNEKIIPKLKKTAPVLTEIPADRKANENVDKTALSVSDAEYDDLPF